MKILVSILTGAALVTSALAIPQTFNSGRGFFGAAGMQFEDFAGQAAAFDAGNDLKGKWAPVKGQKETLKLALDANVFGILASEITAEKSGDKVVKYRVVYSADAEEKKGRHPAKLHDRVIAAINAYTGKSVTLGKSIEHKGVTITVALGGNGDVAVEFTRAS